MPVQAAEKVLAWGRDGMDEETIAQAARTARLPFVHGHVCVMPDGHVGIGATVGSVIPTVGHIIPAAVGVDIGCGMVASETSLTEADLPDLKTQKVQAGKDKHTLMSLVEERIPAGLGNGHEAGQSRAGLRAFDELGRPHATLGTRQQAYKG
jgi:tRNA-splicing ligase RtcB (3'-phosphate/5'-hydroxy nucleic acid ligase)